MKDSWKFRKSRKLSMKNDRVKFTALKNNWDVWLIVSFVFVSLAINLFVLFVVQDKNKVDPPYISAIYKKVEICMTSASILLAALGLVLSVVSSNKELMSRLASKINRAFTWYIIALFTSIVNVGVMPTSRKPDDLLAYKHAALWLWLYLTGPVMYFSLILGTFWFLIIIRTWTKGIIQKS